MSVNLNTDSLNNDACIERLKQSILILASDKHEILKTVQAPNISMEVLTDTLWMLATDNNKERDHIVQTAENILESVGGDATPREFLGDSDINVAIGHFTEALNILKQQLVSNEQQLVSNEHYLRQSIFLENVVSTVMKSDGTAKYDPVHVLNTIDRIATRLAFDDKLRNDDYDYPAMAWKDACKMKKHSIYRQGYRDGIKYSNGMNV